MFRIVLKPDNPRNRVIHSSEGNRAFSIRNLLKLKKNDLRKKSAETIYQLQQNFLHRKTEKEKKDDQLYNFLEHKSKPSNTYEKDLFNLSVIVFPFHLFGKEYSH